MECTGEPFYCFNGENYTEIIHLMYKWTFRSRYRRKYHLNIHGMYRRTFLLLQWWKLFRNYTFNVQVNLQIALQPKITPKYTWNVQANLFYTFIVQGNLQIALHQKLTPKYTWNVQTNLFIASMVKIIQKLYI